MLNKEKIYEVLYDWNLWGNYNLENIFFRKKYLDFLKRWRKENIPKVLYGVRRSGKSFIFYQEMLRLKENYSLDNMLYVNFEDYRFKTYLSTDLLDKIIDAFFIFRKKKPLFLFLDEIQNIKGWENWVLANQNKYKIYLTGSSSKMLSQEISTSLSGRYVKQQILPLNFNEFLEFKELQISNQRDLIEQKDRILLFFEEYLHYGGFPKVVLQDNEQNKKELLQSYLDTIVYKDIAERYKIKNIDKLKSYIYYVSSNNTLKTNVNSLAKANKISYQTSEEYLNYIKEVFLVYELKSYNYSLKKQYNKDFKLYLADLGIYNIFAFRFSENIGRRLENLVFLHLDHENTYYWQNAKNQECDFVIKEKGKIIQAIQVTYELNDLNYKREVNGLLEAMDFFKLKEGLILTYDTEDLIEIEGKKIIVKPVWKWLLE